MCVSKSTAIWKNSLFIFGTFCAMNAAHAAETDVATTAKALSNIEPAIGRLAPPLAEDVTQSLAQQKVTLKYDIYAGGMHALKAFYHVSETSTAYQTSLKAMTKGMIGKVFPWTGEFETMGTRYNQAYTPIQHQANSKWKKKIKKTELSFDEAGRLQQRVYEKYKRPAVIQTEFKEGVTDNAHDMMSGIMSLMQQAGINKKCAGSTDIVDGKRKFNIALKDEGVEMLKKTKHNVFSGPALKCTIEVTPVAGYREKDKNRGWMAVQNHSKERNKMPTIWLGRLENKQIVPVRMEINSSYGTVIAHLSRITMPAKTVKAAAK